MFLLALQSPVPIAELSNVLARREQRVVHRALGVTTATEVLKAGIRAPYVAKDVVKGIAYGLDEIARAKRAALDGRKTGDDESDHEDGDGATGDQDDNGEIGCVVVHVVVRCSVLGAEGALA